MHKTAMRRRDHGRDDHRRSCRRRGAACETIFRSRDLDLRATDFRPALHRVFLAQLKWFFDAERGSDKNSGAHRDCPLRTFREWQRRVGTLTTLGPEDDGTCSMGNVVELRYLTDMPRSDPFEIANYVAAGSNVHLRSDRILLLSGTLGSVIEKDRVANQPWAISATGLGALVGKWIVITTGPAAGSRAMIMRDLGGDLVHVSEWSNGALPGEPEDGPGFLAPFPDGALFPSAPPSPGYGFEVYDFHLVTLGNMLVGYRPERGAVIIEGEPIDVPGGILFREVHVRDHLPVGDEPNDPCDLSAAPSFPQPLGYPGTVTSFVDSIVDSRMAVPGGAANAGAYDTIFRGTLDVNPGAFFFQGMGGYLNFHVDDAPGALVVNHGATAILDGDVVFMGDIEHPDGSLFADIVNAGVVESGPISFWNTNHGLVSVNGGYFHFGGGGGQLYGEVGAFPAFWGRNNLQIFVFAHGEILVEQLVVGGGPSQPPTFEAGAFGTDPFAPIVVFQGCDDGQAFTFDPATGTYVPPGGITTNWADLLVPAPAGFLACIEDFGGGFERRFSEMLKPGSFSGLHFDVFVVP